MQYLDPKVMNDNYFYKDGQNPRQRLQTANESIKNPKLNHVNTDRFNIISQTKSGTPSICLENGYDSNFNENDYSK